MAWQLIATQYAIDRIQQAALTNDQAYIEALVKIESYVQKGGPQSWNEAVAWRELCRRYPADVWAIQTELDPAKAARLQQPNPRPAPRPRESAHERALAKWGLKP